MGSVPNYLARDPQCIDALFHMGLVSEKKGAMEEAAAYFQKVLDSTEADIHEFKKQARILLAGKNKNESGLHDLLL